MKHVLPYVHYRTLFLVDVDCTGSQNELNLYLDKSINRNKFLLKFSSV